MFSFNSQKKLLKKIVHGHTNRLSVTRISNRADWLLILLTATILLIVLSFHSYSTYEKVTAIDGVIEENDTPVKSSEEIDVNNLERVVEMFERKKGVFEGL